jgi:hypothetical protein
VDAFNGNVAGAITGWHGTDASGSQSADANWANAEKVAFTLTGIGKVTIPVAAILGLVPGIGTILKALLSALPGQQITFSLGQIAVEIPVHRVSGNVLSCASGVARHADTRLA